MLDSNLVTVVDPKAHFIDWIRKNGGRREDEQAYVREGVILAVCAVGVRLEKKRKRDKGRDKGRWRAG